MVSLSFLKPREDKFCRLLEDLSRQAADAARQLDIFINNPVGADARAQAATAIQACRVQAKTIMNDLTLALCKSFITPFDREDIQSFAGELYKIPKTIEKVRDRVDMYGLADSSAFVPQVELIVKEAATMEDIVRDLVRGQNSEQVQVRVSALYDLETKGDEVLATLLTTLFRTDMEARDLILRKDLYDMLEKIIDKYRNAAGVALKIVLKHT